MAMDTYANLKTAVTEFSGRDDLTSFMPDFITMAEQAMYFNDDMPLRVRAMDTRTTLTATAGNRFLALPADYLEPRALVIITSGERIEMEYVAPSALMIESGSGVPYKFTITSQIEFNRSPSDAFDFELQYYAKPTALSDANPTNNILTSYPSIYLFGSLSSVHDYSGEDNLAEQYYQKMIRAIKGAIKGDRRGRYGPTPAAVLNGSNP